MDQVGRFVAGDIDKVILNQLGRLIKNPAILVKLFATLQNQEKERRKELLARQSELENRLAKSPGSDARRRQCRRVAAEVHQAQSGTG